LKQTDYRQTWRHAHCELKKRLQLKTREEGDPRDSTHFCVKIVAIRKAFPRDRGGHRCNIKAKAAAPAAAFSKGRRRASLMMLIHARP